MTAIVGIINRRGVAFAADSATTHTISSRHKITNHANKIFDLSRRFPVGAAICGNLDFLGMPWEDIFKMYRRHLGDSSKPMLHDYALDFIEFVKKEIMPGLVNQQESDVNLFIRRFWQEVLKLAKSELGNSTGQGNNEVLFQTILSKLTWFIDAYGIKPKCSGMDNYTIEEFITHYGSLIDNNLKDYLCLPDCPKDLKDKFIQAIFAIIESNSHIYLTASEIIIWGYGENELFPAYESFLVSLSFDNNVRYTNKSKYMVSNENTACIEPFAQTDVANTVVRGVDDDLRAMFYVKYKATLDAFKNKVLLKLKDTNAPKEFIDVFNEVDFDFYADAYKKDMDEYIQSNFIDKVVSTIAYLNKEDLAEMAESLVRMTSLKRKVSTDEESVGGPIDVAVVTKGDGFIWIKRKHYFAPELNHHYLER